MYRRPVALPPLNALRAFAAAARTLSFTRAARELSVTQAAVSHQMRTLERHLGLRLFLRLPRRLALTPEGRAYARELDRVFTRIEDATAALGAMPQREVLALTTLPSFAARWLVPRLPGFTQSHPRLDLRLVATERSVDLGREAIDVGVRFGYGRYAGLHVEKLMDDVAFPVASPRVFGRRRRPKLATLAEVTLLHDDSPAAWRDWLRSAGAPRAVSADRGHVFTDASHMLAAAEAGLGVALARGSLVADALAAGTLVRPFSGTLGLESAYWLVTARPLLELPRAHAFASWLRDQIARAGFTAARPPR